MNLSPQDDVDIRNLLARYCVLLDQDEVEQFDFDVSSDYDESVRSRRNGAFEMHIPIFDADNHLYETKDAFTKFVTDRTQIEMRSS